MCLKPQRNNFVITNNIVLKILLSVLQVYILVFLMFMVTPFSPKKEEKLVISFWNDLILNLKYLFTEQICNYFPFLLSH